MPLIKFSPEQIGRFEAILELRWSLNQVKGYFRKSNVHVSKSYFGWIRQGKHKEYRKTPVKKRRPKPKLSSVRIRAILKKVDNTDPATQRDLAVKYNVTQTTIFRVIRKSYRRLVKKPKVHAMSPDAIEKRHRRSWGLYLLRKQIWRKVITSDEAWFYLKNSQEKRSVQYLKFGQKRKEAEVLPQVSHPKCVMVWIAFSADGFFQPIFVEPGTKINADCYCKKVLKPFHKEYVKKYPHNNMLFHQDSAPSDVSKITISFMDNWISSILLVTNGCPVLLTVLPVTIGCFVT